MNATIGIGQLRANTLAYANFVASGATLGILRRGRQVALMLPVQLVPHKPKSGQAHITELQLRTFRTQAGRYLDKVAEGSKLLLFHGEKPIAEVVSA